MTFKHLLKQQHKATEAKVVKRFGAMQEATVTILWSARGSAPETGVKEYLEILTMREKQ